MRKTLTSLGAALLLSASAFAADTVPWSNDFSGSVSTWKKTAYCNSSKGFNTSSGSLYLAEGTSNVNIHNEAWICFTPDGFQLEKGKGYKFEMTARTNQDMPNSENHFRVMLIKHLTSTLPSNLGQGQTTVVGATGDVITNYIGTPIETIIAGENIRKVDATAYTGFFEVPEDGVYDLCLYVYTPTAHSSNPSRTRALYFDDFKLAYGSMDAPDAAAMTVTPDASGILKAQISVTAPTKTIRGEALTSISKMEIYRDGGIVKEIANPTPGSTVTFTDYAAQPGNHTYSAIAYNDNGPGQQLDVTTAIGGLPEAQTWDGKTYCPYWAKYLPDGKVRIEWPAVHNSPSYGKIEVADEGLTYKVQTVSGREIKGEIGTFTRITNQLSSNPDCEVKMYYIIDDAFDAGTEPIGWQYKVSSVNEAGTETHLGYTNYISLNNEVPYYPNLKTTTALQGFTADCDYSYALSASSGTHVQIGLSRPYGYHDKAYFYNNWFISPGLKLSKDKFYRVKITSAADGANVAYTIKAGKGSYREALDIMVAEENPVVYKLFNSDLTVKQTDEMFLSVEEDGMYFVGIMPSMGAAMSSSTYRLERFDIIEVDPTLPDAPTGVKVAYSPTAVGKATITYVVPTKAINGEDVAGLTKIEIYKNGEAFMTVTDGVKPGAELSFDVDVTAGQEDVYTIRAFNAAGQGESASTTIFVLSTPYSNDFSSKNALQGFTQINNLKSGQDFGLQNDKCRLFYSEMGNDHWLILPPITLTKDQYYQFNYNIKATADGAGDCEVFIGKAPSQEAMTDVITEKFEINAEQNIFNGLHEEWFTVEENGQYFIGFHLTKEPGYHNKEIYIDDLAIATGVMGTTPDKGVLKVTPAADASLKATLSYTVPTKALNGTDLNANSTQAVSFYINNVQTAGAAFDASGYNTRTFQAYPGQTVSIDIVVPDDLPYIFSAKAGNQGRPHYVDAFVGLNIPYYPQGIQIKETQPYGHVQLSWDPVTMDQEGYAMNPDNVHYEVMKLEVNPYNEEQLIEVPVLTDIEGTTCEFDAIAENAAQTMMRYVLRARAIKLDRETVAGGKGSQGVLTKYVNVGKPYRMPYQESFSGANNQPGVKTAVFSETLPESEGPINWGIMRDGLDSGIKSGDGDGCYLAMEVMWLGSKGRFYTGKINLSGVDPEFSFMLYNPSITGDDAPNTIQPMIFTVADGKWHEVAEAKSVSELTNNQPGWSKVSYDLSKYADQIVIVAIDALALKHTFTSVDNLKVWEAPATDFSFLGHNTPLAVTPGQSFNVDLKVTNSGKKASKPESIEMYVDGNLAQTLEGTEIGAGEAATVSFTHSIPAVDLATSHELKFVINSEADADILDNETTATIATVNTHLATVENLTADVNNDTNIVTLNWDAPKGASEDRVTETFEKFVAGNATQFGWTAYDADGRELAGINDGTGYAAVIPGLPYHGQGSWAVIDLDKGPFPASTFPAVSGKKFLMAMVPDSEIGTADDWFISPLLSGKAQDITFWVRNIQGYPNGIQLLYSEGGMTTDDFKQVQIGSINYGEWQGIRFSVPEGAKRFAIRNISYCDEGWMTMLDDIAYDPAVGEDVALQGYNVYSENECLAQPTETLHALPNYHEMGEYVYGVSARYAHGESAVVPVKVSVLTSGVTEVSIADGIHIFGGKGCINITGAEGENVVVYDLNGQELANGQVSGGQIAAAPGVYVVVAGGKSQKVLVK